MFAVLMDRKGFHKVVDMGYQNIMRPVRTIRWAATDLRSIAPGSIERAIEMTEQVESSVLVFNIERQLNSDTFLYRQEPANET